MEIRRRLKAAVASPVNRHAGYFRYLFPISHKNRPGVAEGFPVLGSLAHSPFVPLPYAVARRDGARCASVEPASLPLPLCRRRVGGLTSPQVGGSVRYIRIDRTRRHSDADRAT
jgi:hypothetical protein